MQVRIVKYRERDYTLDNDDQQMLSTLAIKGVKAQVSSFLSLANKLHVEQITSVLRCSTMSTADCSVIEFSSACLMWSTNTDTSLLLFARSALAGNILSRHNLNVSVLFHTKQYD